MAVGTSWVGAIVIDCRDLPRMIEFWREALHYVPRDRADADGVVLKDPTGHGPNVSLQRTNEPPTTEYRLHLDLYSPDATAEVRRLIALGAELRRPAGAGDDFVTLADPDGNLFDVVAKSGWSFGQRA
ncbi:MAG: VOC family protein [Thermoplasmata archaeon]|nr:VOC family protein [Thermoplasmata archaeon]